MKKNLDIQLILARLASALKVSSEDELAEALGVAKATIATWKKRNKIPYDHIVNVAANKLISVDSILFGEAPQEHDIHKIVGLAKSVSDIDLAETVFHLLDEELLLTEQGLDEETLGTIISAMQDAKRKLPGGFYERKNEEHASIVEQAVNNYLHNYYEIMHIAKNKKVDT